jgi:hypothetical protein
MLPYLIDKNSFFLIFISP